ncbi:MAG: hydroxymethylglutaryl-CoA lyase [Telmatospirillum sp.]|nr:hydroxymethylglutaryl-CoA lyase [Telmatospirillum sp.]
MSGAPGRPSRVTVVEVGPRDGLQNEKSIVGAAVKADLIRRRAGAGLPVVEAGAFVSPARVPQMADTAEVLALLEPRPAVSLPVLVPNRRGLEAALEAGAREIALFVSASEGFSQRNIACSRAESLARLSDVAALARSSRVAMRGYVSCVIACPYDGPQDPAATVEMVKGLVDLGCGEISLGDTIGVGTADSVRRVIDRVARHLPRDRIAMHFHDTYGQAVANVLASLEEGIAVFDSSVAGLGGCPFAVGATGNLATEDLLFLLDGLGIETGVDLAEVVRIGTWISGQLGRANASRAGRALAAAAGGQTGSGPMAKG